MHNSFKHLQHTAGTVNLCACIMTCFYVCRPAMCAAAPLLNDGWIVFTIQSKILLMHVHGSTSCGLTLMDFMHNKARDFQDQSVVKNANTIIISKMYSLINVNSMSVRIYHQNEFTEILPHFQIWTHYLANHLCGPCR